MKKSKLFFVVSVVLVCLSIITISCQKQNNTLETKESDLNNVIQSYFTQKYQLLTQTTSGQEKKATENLASFYVDSKEANKHLDELKNEKAANTYEEFIYSKADINTAVLENSLKLDGNSAALQVLVSFSIETNGKDEESGVPIVLEGRESYDISLVKENQKWRILKEEKSPEFLPETNSGNAESNASDGSNESEAQNKTATYTYNGTTAANYAYNHYSDIVTFANNYTNYTNDGGDCTNFLSRCLREGGWEQTKNWHFISNGASCNTNMTTCKRSPSWTKAKYFYEYINNIGMYQGVNGNNRVTRKFASLVVPSSVLNPNSTSSKNEWKAFYDNVKVLKKGDIIQLATGSPGTVFHSMIVTQTKTTAPYIFVAYRNAVGLNNIYRNREISKLLSERLYGFYLKPSGY